MGLLKYGTQQDFATAARYLQPAPGQDTDLIQRARELHALRSKFKANIALLSDDPDGKVEPGLPPGQNRAGVLTVGDTTVDLILVRVDDPASGKIWLVSNETVARIPDLYARMGKEAPTAIERIEPAALTSRNLLGISLAQWLGWLLSIPVSWFLAWLLTLVLSAPRRVWCKLHKVPFRTIWSTPLGMPLKCILAILMHVFIVYKLRMPLFHRFYYNRFVAGILAACFVWLTSRIVDLGFERVVNRRRIHHSGGESILIVMQRLTRIVMLIIAVIISLALFGVNVKTALAGFGIGGLAVALAAQRSLENVIGGVSLLMDKAVSVGDFCLIGNQLGTVEDIGLRSLKLRTLDQDLLVMPNGSLAQMQFANRASRTKLLINDSFSLRIETRTKQLRFVLDRVQNLLDEHPEIESGTSRVRVKSLAGAAFEVELFAYVKTGNWVEFTAIRHDIMLKIADIVEASGARFAAPTRLNYQSSDTDAYPHKADAAVRLGTEPRASDSFRLPTGTE